MVVLKIFLKLILWLFATIGFAVVAGGLYIWFADPFHLKPLLWPAPAPQPAQTEQPAVAAPNVRILTPQQQAAVSRFTPATEQCAVAALGRARVDEIKSGASPTPADIALAGHCLQP